MRVKLTNDRQRLDFIRNYEAWGVWFFEPRLRINLKLSITHLIFAGTVLSI